MSQSYVVGVNDGLKRRVSILWPTGSEFHCLCLLELIPDQWVEQIVARGRIHKQVDLTRLPLLGI